MNCPVIKINNLWFFYDNGPVLKEVNLEVYQNDFLAFIGPNGGGKTTLLKLMLGLLAPTKGTIKVFGKPPKKTKKKIGYVPQDCSINRTFPISVIDVVMTGRIGFNKAKNKDDIRAVHNTLEKLGVLGIRNHRIGDISGGQRQRIFIARALVSEPKILFLDEPAANIDAKGQLDIYNLFKQLNKKITIVITSHDLMVLSDNVKSIACINQSLHFHDVGEITDEILQKTYNCPVELLAHSVPHRVLRQHQD